MFQPQFIVESTDVHQTAAAAFRQPTHAAFIIDLGAPDLDGFLLLRELRAVDQRPTVMLSSNPDPDLPARCYDHGADGFLRKPFRSPRELASLLSRLLLRTAAQTSPRRTDGILLPTVPFRYGGFTIDPIGSTARLPDGQLHSLSPKEVGILSFFARHAGQLARRDALIHHVWGPAATPRSKSLDTFLFQLRTRLEAPGASFRATLKPLPKVGWHVSATALR